MYLEDSQAPVLLTEPAQQQRAESLATYGCRVVCVSDLVNGASNGAHDVEVSAEDPAYIIFTSGSTGRPKGCVLLHRGLQDLLPWLIDLHQLGTSCLNAGSSLP